MAREITLRNDTTTNWETKNPVLDLGEVGVDVTKHNFKIGDGNSAWLDIKYSIPTALQGVTVPSSTPEYLGQMYVDTALGVAYIACGTSSSSDWKQITQ